MNYRLAAASVLVAAAIIPIPSGAQAPALRVRPTVTRITVPKILDTAIDANIDVSITGAARQTLRDTMKGLRQTDRQNVVILMRDGSLLANHTSLLAHAARATLVAGTTNRFTDRRGHLFIAAPFDKSIAFAPRAMAVAFAPEYAGRSSALGPLLAASPPDASGTTGPYRRVYSNPGFSFAEGMVSLSCGNSNLQPGPQSAETGYVYAGGFSDGGDQVDAGLQYSAFSGNYSMYLSRLHSTGPPMTADEFNCGQNVQVAFYVSSYQNQPVLNIVGTFNNQPNYSYTFTDGTVTNADGWAWNGGQNIMKRMTTIAQDVQTLNDGSFFAYGGGTNSLLNNPQMGLYSWGIGTSYDPSSANPGSTWDQMNGNGQKWPNDDTKVQTALYSNGVGWDEIEGINLHP